MFSKQDILESNLIRGVFFKLVYLWNLLSGKEFRRRRSLVAMENFSAHTNHKKLTEFKSVLLDGMWDNPNFWLRFALVRKGLHLQNAEIKGLLGNHSRAKSSNAFKRFGICKIIDFAELSNEKADRELASKLLRSVKEPKDILKLSLPHNFPAELFYDGALKRQRRASVDIDDSNLEHYLAEAIGFIEAGHELIKRNHFDLVLLSHGLDYTYGALAWASLQNNVPVIVMYGDFGHQKFMQLKQEADLFRYPERPSFGDLCSLSEQKKELLMKLGKQQLAARYFGQTGDVGAIFAYQKRKKITSRELIAKYYDWDESKPLIGVYNSNWFDFPHCSGLREFSDFLEWINFTLKVAKQRTDVNWLFKAHPCDDWYGFISGETLEDLVRNINLPHIKLADKNWNSFDLMKSLDGIVTCHGTIGIEATSQAVPVLVPYTGWYGHIGFVTSAKSKEDYSHLLKTNWWEVGHLNDRKMKADLTAGLLFCVPSWHENYVLEDDSQQDDIYRNTFDFIQNNFSQLERDAEEVQNWYISDEPYFHQFKMKRASSFKICLKV